MKCIKCGREIPDGELFCVECSLPPRSEPPKASRPHRQTGAKPAPRTQPAPRSEPHAKRARAAEPAPRRTAEPTPGRRPRRLIAALVIVSLLLAGAAAFIALNFGKLAVERRQLRTREADLTLRENEQDDLTRERDELAAQLAAAQTTADELNDRIDQLEQQLNDSKGSVSQAQYDMTSQQQELDRLTAENEELLTTVGDLNSQVDDLDRQIDELTASNAVYGEKASFMDSYVVFVNNDGSKLYHKYDCADFNRQSFWAYSRKLAESNGYSACPKCSD